MNPMRMVRRLFVWSAVVGSCALSGCAWERTVVNSRAKDLDTSFIELGKTNFREVLREMGPPDVPIKDIRTFHYRRADSRTSIFRIAYFVFLPFIWADDQRVVDTLIEMDERGVVTDVVRSTRDSVRPPFETGANRRPETVTAGKERRS